MITCESFRTRFVESTDDAALLAHLRTCDRCLDHAASVDPDVMFRALGGEAMIPPGGVDAFVDGVMQQVRVRTVETTATAHQTVSWPRRLAVAATLAAGITGAAMFYQGSTGGATAASAVVKTAARSGRPSTNFATKPVVETYESENATIVEVPNVDPNDDVKIVMIFDENLPADL
jgi:hypothetical protein